MKHILLTTAILILTTLMVQAQTPSVPPLINYQGMLTDAGRELSTFQYDQFQSHTHKWGAYRKDSMSNGTRDPIVPGTSYETSPPTQDGDVRCGSETRPKNIAVNFIIKY